MAFQELFTHVELKPIKQEISTGNSNHLESGFLTSNLSGVIEQSEQG